MRDKVQFTLNGQPVAVTAPDPTRTLLAWLREDRRLTGTKEGCAEGDCGACTVMATGPDGKVRALNSCIQFLPMVDGCAITTVEGLAGADGALNPLQRAMADGHASQCGFCTPGFVMALSAHHAKGGAVDTPSLCSAIAGNLCRCTGYGPILAAGAAACSGPRPPGVAAPPAPQDALGYEATDDHGARRYFAPTKLDDLLRILAAHPGAIILAGATDVGLWVTKQGRRLETIVSLARVAELGELTFSNDTLTIGAAVRYADALGALATLHPAFSPYLDRLGATQVRDSATIVGNIANGSPIGDMPPALIALDADIELLSIRGQRRLKLEDFFLDYGRQDRAPDEIVARVIIRKPQGWFAAEKVSKRFEQDISAVSAGLHVVVAQGVVTSARIAFGGMAGVPKRARAAEDSLTGSPWTEQNLRQAGALLDKDFTPMSDWRGSAAYRMATARALLLRFFQETQGEQVRIGQLKGVAHG